MKNVFTPPVAQGITRRAGMLTLLGSALALAGCGGGGDVAGLSSGGTGSFSVGPITGYGSIFVGLIRFEDSTASSILDIDDDNSDMRGKLKLGMVVRVKGKPKSGIRADADTIEVRSELLGLIDSVDTTAKTLLVLGQTVQVTTTTVFEEGLTGLSALTTGNIVEVHGFVDPLNNRLTATRIERKDLANVKAFKLQGAVSELNVIPNTFKIGALTISFTASVTMPTSLTLTNGMLVRVRLATTPITGTRTALKIRAAEELEIRNCDESEVEGLVTFIDPLNSKKFSVNGLPVDATGVSVFVSLQLGDRVEVEGSLVNGVLVAKEVELEDEDDDLEFELHGKVSNVLPTTFTLTSSGGVAVNVSYASALISDLKIGDKVEVKGTVLNAPDASTIIVATRITRE